MGLSIAEKIAERTKELAEKSKKDGKNQTPEVAVNETETLRKSSKSGA